MFLLGSVRYRDPDSTLNIDILKSHRPGQFFVFAGNFKIVAMQSKSELNTLMHCMMAQNRQNLESWKASKMSLRCPDVNVWLYTKFSSLSCLSFFLIRYEIYCTALFCKFHRRKGRTFDRNALNWLNIIYHTPFKVD